MQNNNLGSFLERLQMAMRHAGYKDIGASMLALQFNLRYPHEPISQQAAQKWLSGKAIPRPEKILTLASWL